MWSWNFTRSPYFYNPQVAVYQACLLCRSHHIFLISCRHTDVYYDHFYLHVCIQCLYNVQSKFAIVFLCELCYTSISDFICNFIREIWKINWIEFNNFISTHFILFRPFQKCQEQNIYVSLFMWHFHQI